ncbi:MAG: hypothetical protein Q8P57_02080 [Candidatus Pacearchaeota archaeon]|nr:hypothetical protein [Candidatus Pacearchaeota archaeon]
MVKPIATYAFEGINAGGKSTVIKEISSYFLDRGYSTNVNKIGGLGDSLRMNRLKKILDYRERLKRENQLTHKQEQDFIKDRIFRLAIRKQINDYQKREFENKTISLLDRTPLMSWAYSSSVDPSNHYLNEILEEGLNLSERLGIDTLFLLEIDAISVYSRIICRSLEGNKSIEEEVEDLTDLIPATEEIKKKVARKSLESLTSGVHFHRKKFRIWDFMSYEEIERQGRTYLEAAKMMNERTGTKVVRINARESLNQVLANIKEHTL